MAKKKAFAMNWRHLARIGRRGLGGVVVAFGLFTNSGDGGHTHQERYRDPQTRVLSIPANPCDRFSMITSTPEPPAGFPGDHHLPGRNV